jgi:hypothetical protein
VGIGRLARTMRNPGPAPVSRSEHAAVFPRVVQRTEAGHDPGHTAMTAADQVAGVIQRQIGGHRAGGRGATQQQVAPPTLPAVPQLPATPTLPIPSPVAAATGDAASAAQARAARRTTSDVLNDFEELVDMIEQRVLNELERRGGRVRGWW